MSRVSCVGDTVVGTCDHGDLCCPHNVVGKFVEGSEVTFIRGRAVVRKGDRCATSCPHCGTGEAYEASDSLYSEGKPVHLCGQTVKLGGGWGVSLENTDPVFSER